MSGASSLTARLRTSGARLATVTVGEETGVPSSMPSEGVTTACHASPLLVAEDGSTFVVWLGCTAPFRYQAMVVPLSGSPSSSLYVYVRVRASVVSASIGVSNTSLATGSLLVDTSSERVML